MAVANFLGDNTKVALCLSIDSTYFPFAGQHICAGVGEIFNQKTASVA